MTPLHGIACFYYVGFGARAVSRKTPIYFILLNDLVKRLILMNHAILIFLKDELILLPYGTLRTETLRT